MSDTAVLILTLKTLIIRCGGGRCQHDFETPPNEDELFKLKDEFWKFKKRPSLIRCEYIYVINEKPVLKLIETQHGNSYYTVRQENLT